MHACDGTHTKDMPWDRGSTWWIHQWITFSWLKLNVLNLHCKRDIALMSLWVWVGVEGSRDCVGLHTRIVKLLISFLDSKFVLTLESHISLDWNCQSQMTYALRFAHATFQFLGSRGNRSLEWRMLFISVIISAILMLMTIFAHKTTCI